MSSEVGDEPTGRKRVVAMGTEGQAQDRHQPVLLQRCLTLLTPVLIRPGAVVVDATLGMGGHSEALLHADPQVRVIGIDRDRQALELARERLAPFADRVHLTHAVYDELPRVLDDFGVGAVDGVLFDLGVSSLHLDETDRGFSYASDSPLDMRMDPEKGPSAAEVLNTYSTADLTRVLREYGEERFAPKIASAIVRERQIRPWDRSARLVELIRDVVPAPARRTGGHPAKRTFQALRIEVNDELRVLERVLPQALDALVVDGRIVVLAYHSLEDRLVKRALAAGARSTTPADLPVELPGHAPMFRLLTRGAEKASAEEIDNNPRAASVRLRAAVRIRADRGATGENVRVRRGGDAA
jgi:16S rRNA (cytosine1402-N4)-methyltransferase